MTGVDFLTSYLVEPWMSWHQGFYKTVQLENVAYSILFFITFRDGFNLSGPLMLSVMWIPL